MTDPGSLRIIAGWCANLAELCRHGEEGKPSKEKIAVYATMLGTDFPSGAFTTASLHAAVHGAEWFPAYDVIRERIAVWWREHKPASAPNRIGYDGAPAGAELSGIDRAWLDYWFKRQAEGFGPAHKDGPPADRAHVLSLVRQQSIKAYRAITGETEPVPREPGEYEREYVSNLLRPYQERSAPERKAGLPSKPLAGSALEVARREAGIRSRAA